MPLEIKINDTSCEIQVGDETSGEFVKFNAKTEKDGPKALFYHIKGKEGEDKQKEITDSYQSLEGMIHRMYNA